MSAQVIEWNIADDFKTFLKENQLPVPPLPLAALDTLIQTDEFFFATDRRDIFAQNTSLSLDLLEILKVNAPLPPIPGPDSQTLPFDYCGCGLCGHGIQSWRFRYILLSPHLNVILSLPWGNAYNDPEEERDALERGLALVQVCQQQMPEQGCLFLTLDESACFWRMQDDEGQVLRDGTDLPRLMDELDGSAHAASMTPFQENWTSV